MSRGDAELLDAVLNHTGEARTLAWNELVERHTARLWAVARAFRFDEATAADLVQTAWLRLIERGHQVRDPEQLGAWLAMVVRNESRRLATRRRVIPTDHDWDRTVDPDARAPDQRLLANERTQAVRLGLARISEDCRALITLLVSDPPLSYAEIAAALDRPVGSIGPTRQRCLDHLRSQLPTGLAG